MHNGAGGVDHEIQQLRRRALAVEFGEKREHAAAQPDTRKRGAGGGIQVFQFRSGGPRPAREHGLQVSRRDHGQCGQPDAGLSDHGGQLLQFLLELPDAFDHDFEHGVRPGLLAEDAVAIQFLQPVLAARIEMADQETRCGELQEIQLPDRMFDLLRGHAQADRLQGLP